MVQVWWRSGAAGDGDGEDGDTCHLAFRIVPASASASATSVEPQMCTTRSESSNPRENKDIN